ncbi:unnamed protein product, partial [Iphiclides podalirius]
MGSKTPTESSPPLRVQVKKENEEEIKDFAETAMNELLGWYGYERLELRRWAASRARDNSSPEQAADQKGKDECSWCGKSITGEGGALQQAGSAFCSELCFSQSRRANFKRAKTCDWCRHVRHTVAYVDFQDGATQLQFCSDKCLNQYKMHIFCRETQAHLDLNPHLANASTTSSLITPELWLRNCKSGSASPVSEHSESPKSEQTAAPLPLITVAPAAKLMRPKTEERREEKPMQRSPETRKERATRTARKRRASKCSATVTSQSLRSGTPKAQDLRLRSPSVEGSQPFPHYGVLNDRSGDPRPFAPLNGHSGDPRPFAPLNGLSGDPTPFASLNGLSGDPQTFPGVGFQRPAAPDIPPFPPLSQPPPVTVLVPYPVLLPIPLPIPIPMPMSAFARAHRLRPEPSGEETEPLDFTMTDRKRDEAKPAPSIETAKTLEEPRSLGEPRTLEEPSTLGEPRTLEEPRTLVEPRTLGEPRTLVEPRTLGEPRTLNEPKSREADGSPEQALPKFKITRLARGKASAKAREAESSRPLRKRRRLVEVPPDDEPLIPKTRKTVEV